MKVSSSCKMYQYIKERSQEGGWKQGVGTSEREKENSRSTHLAVLYIMFREVTGKWQEIFHSNLLGDIMTC